jgi:hypothetical protein
VGKLARIGYPPSADKCHKPKPHVKRGARETFSTYDFLISRFAAGVKWILRKAVENTRNVTSRKLLDKRAVGLV